MIQQDLNIRSASFDRLRAEDDAEIIYLARLVIDASRAFDSQSSAVRELLSQARRVLEPTSSFPPIPDRGKLATWQARKAASYIEDHADQPIRVADVAASVRLSPSYFSHAFRESFGVHVRGYITGRRISKAQTLMLETRIGLAEVALACGFSDQAHFCRAFGAATGQTPARWRRARQPAPEGASHRSPRREIWRENCVVNA